MFLLKGGKSSLGEELYFKYALPYSCLDGKPMRPIIPVTIQYNGRELTTPMLVDSGADSTLLPTEVAVDLRIDLGALEDKEGTGLGGTYHYRRVENVKLLLAEDGIELVSPVQFVEDYRKTYGLLGREIVFDLLRVAFRQYNSCYTVYMSLEDQSA